MLGIQYLLTGKFVIILAYNVGNFCLTGFASRLRYRAAWFLAALRDSYLNLGPVHQPTRL
jgi:hypothetical protein